MSGPNLDPNLEGNNFLDLAPGPDNDPKITIEHRFLFNLSSTDNYQPFIDFLRRTLADKLLTEHNTVRILPKTHKYFTITLITNEGAHAQVLIAISNLYLIGYRVSENSPWIGFSNTLYSFLPFTGCYTGSQNLVDRGGIQRERLPLTRSRLIKSTSHLFELDPRNHQKIAAALLCIIQMVCEGIRFNAISDHITHYYNQDIDIDLEGEGEGGQGVKTELVGIQYIWGKISSALQDANYSLPLINKCTRKVYSVADAAQMTAVIMYMSGEEDESKAGGPSRKHPGGPSRKHPGGPSRKHAGGSARKDHGGPSRKHPGGSARKDHGADKNQGKSPGGAYKKGLRIQKLDDDKIMRETLIYLSHLDHEDTEKQMLKKLSKQPNGEDWTWNNLNTLCGAIGSISRSMMEEQMITKNFEDYPEHCLKFFSLLRAIATYCFQALILLSSQQLKLVMDSIIWAFRHTERNIAETGLNLLLEMLKNFQASEFCNQFYRSYFLTIEQEIFAVLTDTFHEPGFKLHASVLQHLFCPVESSSLTEPLWDASTVTYPYPNNTTFIREYTIKLLGSSFPNMTATEVTQFVNGLYESRTDLSTFKNHIRDFILQSKEFSAQDNKDLYAEEAAARSGFIAPSEIQDEMVDL